MSSAQKAIKYLAIALALFLMLSIISGIVSALAVISNIFDNKDHYEIMERVKDLGIDSDAKILDIDIVSSSVIIKVGDEFKAESSNENIEYTKNKDIIYIKEKKHNWFSNGSKGKLVIYVPNDIVLDGVSINSGAGKVEVEKLSTKLLNLDLGAGVVKVKCLNVLNSAKINGGVGEVIIDNSILNDLELDMGVSSLTFTGKLFGKTEIDHGVGSVKLNLLGSKEDYRFYLNKGLGSVTIDGYHIQDDEKIGTGINKIDIDGGVGNIDINIKNAF